MTRRAFGQTSPRLLFSQKDFILAISALRVANIYKCIGKTVNLWRAIKVSICLAPVAHAWEFIYLGLSPESLARRVKLPLGMQRKKA